MCGSQSVGRASGQNRPGAKRHKAMALRHALGAGLLKHHEGVVVATLPDFVQQLFGLLSS